ncbi:MAG: Rrf2 family transcriptional regulator [Desulfobacteraceae bacterium]|nr:Rrf2 family transcriptional regulator [Desulfobacteraceae bacterium]
MKLSTRSRYGVRLLLDMARNYERGPVRLGDIAERQAIPVKYLEQIIIPLKKAGYVRSVRGPKGGHMLAKAPDAITAGEIVNLLEDGLRLTKCAQNPAECKRSDLCPVRFLWMEATDAIHERLDATTFSDLLKRSRGLCGAEELEEPATS